MAFDSRGNDVWLMINMQTVASAKALHHQTASLLSKLKGRQRSVLLREHNKVHVF